MKNIGELVDFNTAFLLSCIHQKGYHIIYKVRKKKGKTQKQRSSSFFTTSLNFDAKTRIDITYLPTFRIFPIEIQSVESEFGDKLQNGSNEILTTVSVVNQTTVFITGRVVPTADRDQNFQSSFFQRDHSFVEP